MDFRRTLLTVLALGQLLLCQGVVCPRNCRTFDKSLTGSFTALTATSFDSCIKVAATKGFPTITFNKTSNVCQGYKGCVKIVKSTGSIIGNVAVCGGAVSSPPPKGKAKKSPPPPKATKKSPPPPPKGTLTSPPPPPTTAAKSPPPPTAAKSPPPPSPPPPKATKSPPPAKKGSKSPPPPKSLKSPPPAMSKKPPPPSPPPPPYVAPKTYCSAYQRSDKCPWPLKLSVFNGKNRCCCPAWKPYPLFHGGTFVGCKK